MPLSFSELLGVVLLVFLIPREMLRILLLERVVGSPVVLLGSVCLLGQHLLERGPVVLPVGEVLQLGESSSGIVGLDDGSMDVCRGVLDMQPIGLRVTRRQLPRCALPCSHTVAHLGAEAHPVFGDNHVDEVRLLSQSSSALPGC